jgi:hypothetical protein
MKTVAFILVLSALAFFSGCATPAARIERNPEVFAKLSPTEQQTIREGKVAIGFTPEMVKLALGEPDRVFTRTDAQGSTESWSYTTYESDAGVMLYRGFYHRYYGWGDPFFPYYMDYPSRRDREYLKVVFAGGKVSSIEQQT